MKHFKIELHCHTSETSPCGRMTAEELVNQYIQKGYSGIVITDHFTESVFNGGNDTDSQLFRYYTGYRNALIAANGRLKIYRGAELRLNNSCNDYLIYGDSINFLRGGKELFSLKLEEIYEIVKKEGLAIYQAHPNRDGMIQMPHEFLDGIEMYNMHTEHNSRNYLSVAYALQYNVKGISGSDAHSPHHTGRGGILTDTLPSDENGLKDILLSGNYQMIF